MWWMKALHKSLLREAGWDDGCRNKKTSLKDNISESVGHQIRLSSNCKEAKGRAFISFTRWGKVLQHGRDYKYFWTDCWMLSIFTIGCKTHLSHQKDILAPFPTCQIDFSRIIWREEWILGQIYEWTKNETFKS